MITVQQQQQLNDLYIFNYPFNFDNFILRHSFIAGAGTFKLYFRSFTYLRFEDAQMDKDLDRTMHGDGWMIQY